MGVAPLMPREIRKEFIGITYEEFKIRRFEDNPFVEELIGRVPVSPQIDEFDSKIQYLIDTVEDLSLKKAQVQELWNLCFNIVRASDLDFSSLNNTYIFPLVSITGEANFHSDLNLLFEEELTSSVKAYFEKQQRGMQPIETVANSLAYWYEQYFIYLKYLGLGLPNSEARYLQSFFETNLPHIESLKSLSPLSFIKIVEVFKYVYWNLQEDYKIKFRPFFLKKSLEEVIVARNGGYYDNYEKLLEDYYSEKLVDKKWINWSFKFFIGYGERPWRLVTLFLITNLLFALLFSIGTFDFNFAQLPSGFIDKLIAFVSFNNTTMLTIGYGDMYPKGNGARLAVLVLQLIGVTISGAAITLFIRKIFRF